MTFSRDFVVFLFLDTFEYGKCLETGKPSWQFLLSKDFVVSPVSRHFPYSRGFVVSPLSRHVWIRSPPSWEAWEVYPQKLYPPVGNPTRPVGDPSGPVGHPTGPFGNATGPFGDPTAVYWTLLDPTAVYRTSWVLYWDLLPFKHCQRHNGPRVWQEIGWG